MLNIFRDENLIHITVNADIENVNTVVRYVRIFFTQYGVRDDNSIILVLRELLNNAIEHGSKNMKELKVIARIEYMGKMLFEIQVEDEGEGFEYRDLSAELPRDPKQIRSRGLGLVASYANQLDFNEKGNCVTVFMSLRTKTEFLLHSDPLSDKAMMLTICPTGDLTAESAAEFRTILLNSFENSDYRTFRFDLSNVEDMDSVILSIFISFLTMIRNKDSDIEMEMTNVSPEIRQLFIITHLDELYTIL